MKNKKYKTEIIPLPNSRLGILYPSYLSKFIERFENEKDSLYNSKTTIYQPLIHQKFIKAFFNTKHPYQSILLYHGLGTGKTCTSLFNYDTLFNMDKNWSVYILIKKSLIGTWKTAFETCVNVNAVSNIKFVIYDAYNVSEKFDTMLSEDKPGTNQLFIVDEVHNFISNTVNNIHHAKHRTRTPALSVYRRIQKQLKANKKNRLMAITATPAINHPYELAILFNLLHANLFPENFEEFSDIFIDPSGGLLRENRNVFQRRILDKVSFVMPSNQDAFAQRIDFPPILIPMSSYQQKYYLKYNAQEKKRKEWLGDTKYGEGTFNIYTRQACNFVFPEMNERYNADSRRAPGTKLNSEIVNQLSIKQKEDIVRSNNLINKFDGKIKKLSADDKKKLKLNDKMMKVFIQYLKKYWDNIEKESSTSISKDIKQLINGASKLKNPKMHHKYVEDFISSKLTSEKLKSMAICSRKMTHIALMCCISKGVTVVYSCWVRGEGLQIFELYLENLQMVLGELNDNKISNPSNGSLRYLKFTGELDTKKRFQAQKLVNDESNLRGDHIKIILISEAGAEGISIMNCREIHLLEPYWHEVRSQQVIGRGIRQDSHKLLPKEDRNVAIYRYLSTIDNMTDTLDQIIYESSRNKQSNIDDFLGAIRESAVDCNLFHESNAIHPDIAAYRCFDFSDETKLRTEKGYAYRKNIEEDVILENKGMGSANTEIVRIDVIKINGKINDAIKEYYLDQKTGYCYDIKTQKLIGTTKKDDLGFTDMAGIGIWNIHNQIYF